MPKIRDVLLSTSLAATAALSPTAYSAQQIQCGDVITRSVKLGADIVCPASIMNGNIAALRIVGDDVRVYMSGYEIRVDGGGAPNPLRTGILANGVNGAVVMGPGRIVGFGTGVRIFGGDRHAVFDVDVDNGNAAGAILVDTNFSAIARSSMSSISLMANTAGRGYGNIISENALRGGQSAALEMTGSVENNHVQSNRIGTTGMASLVLRDGSSNYFVGNTVYGRTVFHGTQGSVVEGNYFEDVDPLGTIFELGVNAVSMRKSEANRIVANTFVSAGIGLSVLGDIYFGVLTNRFNLIKGNTFVGRSQVGILFESLADENDARSNTFQNVGQEYVDLGKGNLWP